MIAGIILAAGESKRMGHPKALLEVEGQTFVRRVIGVMQHPSIRQIIVVLGAHADEIRKELEGLEIKVVENHDYPRGQLSSLVTGIRAAEKDALSAVLVHPVDHPMVAAKTVKNLVDRFLSKPFSIVIPTFRGKRGHPVIFPSILLHELQQASPSVGARSIVWKNRERVVEVPCTDAGVLRNVDTVSDYDHLREHLQNTH